MMIRAHADGGGQPRRWLRPEHEVASAVEAGLLALLGASNLLVLVQPTDGAQVRPCPP
jgi:hypothetical protein